MRSHSSTWTAGRPSAAQSSAKSLLARGPWNSVDCLMYAGLV